jgi:hypothetical protein
MNTYKITLTLTTDLNPNKWNWHELVDVSPDETLFVEVESVA